MVQWLRFHASIAGGMGSIPGQGTKIPHATWHSQLKKKKMMKGKGAHNRFKKFQERVDSETK